MEHKERRLIGLVLAMILLAIGQGCGSAAMDGEIRGEAGDPNRELPNPDDEPEPQAEPDPEPTPEPTPEPAPEPAEEEELAPVTDLRAELVMLGGDDDQHLWGTAEDDLFLASESGLLAHFDGERWLPFELGPQFAHRDFIGLFGFSSKDVYASTHSGEILHFDGETWKRSELPSGGTAVAIWGSAPDDVYATGSADLFHFDGNEWTHVESKLPPDRRWTAISGSGPNDLVIVGSESEFPRDGRFAHFDGFKWTEIEVPSDTKLLDVWSAGSGTAFAVGPEGKILFFDGKALTPMQSGTTRYLQTVWGRSFGEVFAAGYGVMRRFDGSTWSGMQVPTSHEPDSKRSIDSIIGFEDGGLLAAGQGVDRLEGGSWQSLLPHSKDIEDIWASGPDDVLFVGSVTHRYDGRRVEPEDFGSGEMPALYRAWGSEEIIYATGYVGNVFRYDGEQWGQMTSNTSRPMSDIFGTSADDVFSVGEDGTIMHFDGTEWGAQVGGTDSELYGVWAAGPDDVYAVGDDGTILHYDGEGWSAMDSDDDWHFQQVIGFDAEHIVATNDHGGMHVGDGLVWRPEQAETEGEIIYIRALHGTAPDNLFAASYDGLSHYNGETWTYVSSQGGAGSEAIFAVGPREVYVAGRHGAYRFSVPSP